MTLQKKDFIYKKLDMLKDKIILKKTIIEVIKLADKKDYLKLFENLRKSNKIKYVFLNYYYILSENERKNKILIYSSEDMVLSILNKLKIKWHYTFTTALVRKKIIWQTSKTIFILNNKISKKMIINKTPFHFIKTQTNYIFDVSQIKSKNRISTYYSSNEKLFIDYIYFKKKVPIELKRKVNKTKLLKIIKKYPINIQTKIKNENK